MPVNDLTVLPLSRSLFFAGQIYSYLNDQNCESQSSPSGSSPSSSGNKSDCLTLVFGNQGIVSSSVGFKISGNCIKDLTFLDPDPLESRHMPSRDCDAQLDSFVKQHYYYGLNELLFESVKSKLLTFQTLLDSRSTLADPYNFTLEQIRYGIKSMTSIGELEFFDYAHTTPQISKSITEQQLII